MNSDHFKKQFPIIVSSLENARKINRLAHAYLICGDNADIRRNSSLYLAQITLCLKPGDNGAPCGKCKSCHQITTGTYPELYVLAPSSKSRIIPVGENESDPDTVRWFENRFYLTSVTEAGKKIGIILEADRMQSTSQNAFLKTLEEPPANTMLILATGNPSELLPTIRSRCQNIVLIENLCKYDFKGISELFDALADLQFRASNLTEAESCAKKVIALSDNLYSIAEEETTIKWQKQLEEIKENKDLEAPVKKKLMERYEAAIEAEYLRNRTFFLSAIHTWFAQIYITKSTGVEPAKLSNPEIFEGRLAPGIDKISEKQALKSLTAAEELLQNLKWNVDEELALRAFCLNAANL
jgi:DNA polymerase-3 subunit delta'